jgi:AsmA-like C-terminal region
VLVSTAIALVVALVVLAMHWPFTKQAVIKSLQDASSGAVEIADFHGTYFPFPGCIAEGVIFRHSSDPNATAFITVGKLTIQGSFLGLLTSNVSQIRAEKLHIIFSSFDAAQKSPSPSSSTIDEIVANGAVLEFTRSPGKPPLIFAIHDSTLRNIGARRSLSFQVTLSNPEPPGDITASGRFGPWKVGDAGQTPVSGIYTFHNADLGVFHGIAGMLSSHGKFQGTLGHIGVQGSTETPHFEVTLGHHPVQLETQFDAFVNAENGDVVLQQVDSTFNKTTVISKGSVVGTPGRKGKTATVDMQVRNGRIQDILRLFVKSDESPMSGAVSLRARATIPPGAGRFLTKVRLSSDFGVDDGSFKTKTQQHVDQLSAASRGENDVNPATVLSDLKGHVELHEGIATLSNLSFGVPGASAEMHGTYDLLTKGIDLHGILKMDSDLSKAAHGVKSCY